MWMCPTNRGRIFHDAPPFNTGSRHVERDCRANNIRRFDDRRTKRFSSEHDESMRIRRNNLRSEFHQLRNPLKPAFGNFVPKLNRTLRFYRKSDHERKKIDRKIRPRSRFDLWQKIAGERFTDNQPLPRANQSRFISFIFDLNSELFEGAVDQSKMLSRNLVDADLAAGNRSERQKSRNLVMIGRNRCLRP